MNEMFELDVIKSFGSHFIKFLGLEKIIAKNKVKYGELHAAVVEVLRLECDQFIDKDYDEILLVLEDICDEIACEYEKIVYLPILERNIKELKKILSLNRVEEDILKFTITMKYYETLNDLMLLAGDLSNDKVYKLLSLVLQHQKESIKKALSYDGRLNSSGILSLDRDRELSIAGKLDLYSQEFVEMMVTNEGDIYDIFKKDIRVCKPAILKLCDFSHIDDSVRLIVDFLKNSKDYKGVNILLYGEPGVGKSELAKVIAKELGMKSFEISVIDEENKPLGESRIKALKSAQYLFDSKESLLIFDEIEDIFDNFRLSDQKMIYQLKGWMNFLLENSKVPTIWISNSIKGVDSAIIRRFKIVLELPNLPKSKRVELLKKEFESLDETTIETIAAHKNATPAILSQAAKVVRVAKPKDFSKSTIELISSTLKAQGFKQIEPKSLNSYDYDPALVNCSMDLKELAKGIAKQKDARLCLFGPSGTGKSAFGRWLADFLDMPCIVKKGSDLVSAWV